MKVYRDRLGHATDINETEILDVVKSISVGIRSDYALITSEFSVDQSDVEKARKNRVKYRFITLFRIPSTIEVYINQTYTQNKFLFSAIYNSESLSCWRMFGVYFTGVPFRLDKCTFIGEV